MQSKTQPDVISPSVTWAHVGFDSVNAWLQHTLTKTMHSKKDLFVSGGRDETCVNVLKEE